MRNSVFVISYSFIIVFLFTVELKSQEHFYYYGKKIPVEVSENQIILKFKNSITEQQQNDVFQNEPVLTQSTSIKSWGKNFYKLQLHQKDKIDQIVKRLKLCEEVEIANRVYIDLSDKSELLFGDLFVVQFEHEVTESEIEDFNMKNNITVITQDILLNSYVLKIPADSESSLLEMARKYYETFPVEYSMPDFLVEVYFNGIPNDTYFNNQYYLTDTNVPYAWDITTGSSAVKVAVIDDGCEVHPDLPSSRLWVNTDETAGDTDDDDNNGYKDDVNGYDFYHSYALSSPQFDANPFYDDANDGSWRAGNSYHGLACAGIIAATRNNNTGISGIAPNSKIMTLRVYGELGGDEDVPLGYYTVFRDAIDYAWKNGADVISMSWGMTVGPNWGSSYLYVYNEMSAACQRAMTMGRGDGDMVAEPGIDKGCILVACLGNNADRPNNNLGKIECPANVPGVIGVGAIDDLDVVFNYSPAGSSNPQDGDAVDIVTYSGDITYGSPVPHDWGDCPGQVEHYRGWPRGNIWTLDQEGLPGRRPGNHNICQGWSECRYESPYNLLLSDEESNTVNYTGRFAGTSAACPQVSGLAALILSVNTNLTQAQVRDFITSAADRYPDFDNNYGWGKINANRAMLCAKYSISGSNIFVDQVSLSGTISQNTLASGTILVTNDLTVNNGVNFVIEDGSTVKISSGKRITVNGTGTIIAKNVTFQINGTGNWYGIVVTGTGNASYMKYCTIKDGQFGILIGGSKYINIQHNYISGSNTAIYIYENGNPEINDCYIQGGTEADVLSTGSATGKVNNSKLYGVASAGHKNMGDAATIFNYYNNGRNIIKARYGTSVYVFGGYPTYDNGVNLIERSYGCNFNNSSGHTLYARYNCWGSSYTFSGPVVWQPVNSTCPPNPVGPTWTLQKSSQDALAQAWWAFSDGEFSKAEEFAEQAFNENKTGDRAGEALFLQMKCANQLGTLTEKQNRLVAILNDKGVKAKAKYEAMRWQMKFELKKGNIASARDLALSIPDTSNMSREVLLSLAIALIEELRDFEEAERILSLYEAKSPQAKSPGEESAEEIKNEILSFYKGLYNEKNSLPKESTESTVSIVPEKSDLLNNYPNPFNPNTIIRYQLSTSSHVALKVFDILGREVATLADEQKEAGYYSISFDGSTLTSGIYFVRLVAQSEEGKPFMLTKKLLLMK